MGIWTQLGIRPRYPDIAKVTHTHCPAGYRDTEYAVINAEQYVKLGAKMIPYAEALKVTYNEHITVAKKRLLGGYEDCLDVVRTGHLHFYDSTLCSTSLRTRTFVTAKGGGVHHHYEDLLLCGKPRWCSFSLGDWTLYNSNPEFPPLKEVVLERIRRQDGKKFVVLQLYCDKVTLIDCPDATVINLRFLMPVWFWINRKLRKVDPRSAESIPTWLS